MISVQRIDSRHKTLDNPSFLILKLLKTNCILYNRRISVCVIIMNFVELYLICLFLNPQDLFSSLLFIGLSRISSSQSNYLLLYYAFILYM